MSTSQSIAKKKATGAHFTPPELARFVARRILKVAPLDPKGTIRVLDPACGDGELLLAFAEMLPTECRRRTILAGIESDASALKEARHRLEKLPVQYVELQKADFLEICKNHRHPLQLFDTPPSSDLIAPANIVIANPPYVRTQILGSKKAQELGALFDLKGRVDLYQAFLVATTHSLTPGGVLGVITSNRFLSTQGGASIRNFLAHNYHIIEVFDLGDTKLFEAAVLPAVFIGKKHHHSEEHKLSVHQSGKFTKIYEKLNGNGPPGKDIKVDSVFKTLEHGKDGDYQILGRRFRVSSGLLSVPSSSSEPWRMVTSDERAWLEAVESHARGYICDVAQVRVGIKTTADEVFIRTDWHDLPEDIRPEKKLLRRLLSHDDASRWLPQTKTDLPRQVLYTHEVENGERKAIDLTKYPKAKAYLEAHRERLERRKYVIESGRSWYEIWVPQNPSAWKQPKIVFPDISPEPKFFYDGQGYIVDGNCYWITLNTAQNPDVLFLIQGVANSNLTTRYHDLAFNNKLYAGRRRYLTQYVERYPVPDPNTEPSIQIVSLVKELVFHSVRTELRKQKEKDLEIMVARAFGVDPIFDF